MQHISIFVSLLSFVVLTKGANISDIQRKIMQDSPDDEDLTCLGNPDFGQICCQNCTDCCAEKNDCNFGQGNKGVANIGSFNYGDFNMANSSRGDCNLVDGAWGIGGPEYRGCPIEIQNHVIKYCAINPHNRKCGFPPYHFGDELSDILRDVVLSCDQQIPVRDKPSLKSRLKRRAKAKRALERVRVVKAQSKEEPA